MKLKQCPEDFIVEEINDCKIYPYQKDFQLFLLKKKGIETFYLLEQLSKKNKIPLSEFGSAGVKDKHGITQQFITVPSSYSLKPCKEENLSLMFLGYVDKALQLGDLIGNKFTLVIRAVRKGEFEGIYQKAQTLSQIGVPNYFDSQRFGSVINNKFIAKCLLNKNYEEAVKIYLTESSPFESRIIKEDKKNILHYWSMLEKCSVKTASLRLVVDEYKKTKNWLFTYKKISSSLRQMYISSYQSYLWNECIKLLLKHFLDKKKLYSISYSLGSLLFYKNLTDSESKHVSINFKTISDELKTEGLESEIIQIIMKREGVTHSDFAIKCETGSFFKTHQRDVIVKPSDFSISKPQIDEVNDRGKKNFFKIRLSFSLPKGSYATIVTKRLFNH